MNKNFNSLMYKIARTAKSKHIGKIYSKLIDARSARIILNLTKTHHIYSREPFGKWTLVIK